MPDGFIALDPQGIPEVSKMLETVADEVADPVIEASADYLVNIFQAYPPYMHVPRRQAFPDAIITTPKGKRVVGYFSWKQFQFVMINIAEGNITPGRPHRTQLFRRGWKKVGKGKNLIIANEVPYGPFLKDPGEQSRMMIMEGWQDIETEAKDHQGRMMEKAEASLKKELKKRGLTK